MDATSPLAWLVIPLLGVIITVLVTRRYGNRRKRLSYDLVAVPLMTPGVNAKHDDAVTVIVRGVEMKSPHSVRVTLQNTGPHDVLPEDFPGPLGQFNIRGCTQMGPLRGELYRRGESESARDVGGGGGEDVTLWEFERVHIPRGAMVTFTGVVDGDPTDVVFSDLFDVDLAKAGLPRASWAGLLMILGGFIVGVTGVVLAVISNFRPEPRALFLVGVAVCALGFLVMGVLGYRTFQSSLSESQGWARFGGWIR